MSTYLSPQDRQAALDRLQSAFEARSSLRNALHDGVDPDLADLLADLLELAHVTTQRGKRSSYEVQAGFWRAPYLATNDVTKAVEVFNGLCCDFNPPRKPLPSIYIEACRRKGLRREVAVRAWYLNELESI